ncbi:MAG: YicC/YloC family endoribonuclease [Muribaculaceae bacterium]
MILSMTGFGKAVITYNNKKITVEIKSLNSKQLDLSVRLPQIYREKELELRNNVSRLLERGKVDLYISAETNSNNVVVPLNIPLLTSYKLQIEEMSKNLNIPLPQDWYATLLRLPDALKSNDGDVIDDGELVVLTEAVDKAIHSLIAFRAQEGARLETFFKEKIANISARLKDVEPYEAERVTKIKSRIQESLAKMEGAEYDRGRFEQEMIFYIEKLDINEEKLRLRNHLDYFIDTMNNGHGQGKKLGFITQEMGREINTLGSKSNHPEMQRIVVRMKDELEQMKEQVLNIM